MLSRGMILDLGRDSIKEDRDAEPSTSVSTWSQGGHLWARGKLRCRRVRVAERRRLRDELTYSRIVASTRPSLDNDAGDGEWREQLPRVPANQRDGLTATEIRGVGQAIAPARGILVRPRGSHDQGTIVAGTVESWEEKDGRRCRKQHWIYTRGGVSIQASRGPGTSFRP
ncbi:hypothetical protein DL98DRAFT_304449 [Cadophora sp. DSE1049]|nr:hypothetical protein DL98DRAFT_304449 [Cadophora sp. DSE1049]